MHKKCFSFSPQCETQSHFITCIYDLVGVGCKLLITPAIHHQIHSLNRLERRRGTKIHKTMQHDSNCFLQSKEEMSAFMFRYSIYVTDALWLKCGAKHLKCSIYIHKHSICHIHVDEPQPTFSFIKFNWGAFEKMKTHSNLHRSLFFFSRIYNWHQLNKKEKTRAKKKILKLQENYTAPFI